MAPNREMIEAFVDGRLSASEHELMVHHISSCTECAAAVIAALAAAARTLNAGANERSHAGGAEPTEVSLPLDPVSDLNQLDLILDRASEDVSNLLFKAEPVEEVSLDELPAHRPHVRRPTVLVGGATPVPDLSPPPESLAAASPDPPAPIEEMPSALLPEVEQIEIATAIGVAETAAHGAATLAVGVEENELELLPSFDEPETAEPETAVPSAESAAAGPSAEPPAEEGSTDDNVGDQPSPDRIVEVFDGQIPDAEPAELVTESDWEEPAAGTRAESAPVAPQVTVPVGSHDERIPDDTRAAIAAAVRASVGEEVPPRRRSSTAIALAAAVLIFLGVAAVAALQLRAFVAEVDPLPVSGAELAVAQPEPPSVLEELLSADRVGLIIDVASDSAAPVGGESPPPADTTVTALQSAEPAVSPMARVPRGRPAPSGESRGIRAPPRERVQGITPEPVSGARLVRTTTHRVSPDVDFVLREYEAASPAPAPREGVNEYRWTDAADGRLFVLSGPGTVAELRSYARRLQNGGTR